MHFIGTLAGLCFAGMIVAMITADMHSRWGYDSVEEEYRKSTIRTSAYFWLKVCLGGFITSILLFSLSFDL